MLSAYTQANIKANHEEEVMKKFCFFAVSILYLCLGTTSKAEMQDLGEFCNELPRSKLRGIKDKRKITPMQASRNSFD